MIHHDSDIFYDIYNAINEHNRGQTHDLSVIPNYFELIKKSFYNFICFIINDNFCYHFLNALHALHHYLYKNKKLFAIVNWIFHVLDFWRLFMMSFKYGLIY